MSDVSPSRRTVLVWDLLVRLFHWSLVIGFFTAYFTEGEPLSVHVWAGYVVGGVIVLRVIWGFIGTAHARFSDFVFPITTVVAYLADELRLRGKRYIGHSPAGGAMILALLITLGATTISGLTLLAVHEGQGPLSSLIERSVVAPHLAEAEQGDEDRESAVVEAWEEIHEVLANVSLVLVLLHIGGVVLASYAHKENLMLAMIDGKKGRDNGPSDVRVRNAPAVNSLG
jgi:cytochrome b